jgi:hypothetical protein
MIPNLDTSNNNNNMDTSSTIVTMTPQLLTMIPLINYLKD